ncbi:MAG: xanthine dehydrogenase family protein subunit M [Planctomycetota bacterium]|nr:xanthine dehydrogenase family protein subunit M [Planctomycetota bacterium]
MRHFEFHQPRTLKEASNLLGRLGPGAMVYAGGTDIIPRTRLKRLHPDHLVNIKRIPGLSGVQRKGNTLTIGALTTFNDIIFSDVVNSNLPILAEVARTIASHQVRNLATIGGNLCNAAPSADSAPILIALGAALSVCSPRGKRRVLLEDFFKGPGRPNLKRGEIVTHVLLKKPRPTVGCAYMKHKIRQSLEIAITGVAVALDFAGGECRDARVIVGACAPTPVRARQAESLLKGSALGAQDLAAAADAVRKEISPIDDVRGSAEYRREMTALCLKRAAEIAVRRCGK